MSWNFWLGTSGLQGLGFGVYLDPKTHLFKDSCQEIIVRNPKQVGYLGFRIFRMSIIQVLGSAEPPW